MLRATLPRSRDARIILVGTLFSAIGRGLTLPYLFIYLSKVRGIDAATVGFLVGWMGLLSLLLAPFAGSLIDRLGARRVVLPLLLIEALGTASLALVDSVPTAFLALTATAAGGAGVWSGQTTILAALVDEDERQRTFGLSFTLLNLGIGIGGMASGLLIDETRAITFQMIYLGDGITYLVPLLILLFMRHVGGRLAQQQAETRAERRRGGYAKVLKDKAFVRFIIFGLVLTSCGYAQIEVGFSAFATTTAGVPARVVGWALAANTVVIVVAQLFVLRWLEGRSRTRALSLVGVIFAFSWLVLGLAGVFGQRDQLLVAAILVVAYSMIFASGETMLSPVMPAITNALATDELRGRYNALGSMVWGVSGVVGPVVAGPLIGGGLSTLWLVLITAGCLVASALALMLHARLTPEQDGRHTPDPEPAELHPTPAIATT